MRRWIIIVTGAAAAVAALAAFGMGAQARLMYFPIRYSPDEIEEIEGAGLRRVEFKTEQGAQVAFYAGPAKGLPAKLWLVFGGNGARAVDYYDLAARDDFGYLFIDYPGYGLCEGKPSPRAIDASVAGAVTALAKMLGEEEAVLCEKLCAFGHSLGAAAALRAAVSYGFGEAVLVSPFTTMKAMAERAVGKLLSNALTHRYDNETTLDALTVKRPDARVTIFHGTDDSIVPVAMGRALAQRHPERIVLRAIEGADHNGIVSQQRTAILEVMAAGR